IRVGSHAGDIWYFPGECLLVPSVFMAWLVSELHVHNAVLKTQREVTELTEEKNRAEISLANGERWQGECNYLTDFHVNLLLNLPLKLQYEKTHNN
ncbi:hypothetical protein ACYCNV_26025, partial [Klebsiella pneumoniae]